MEEQKDKTKLKINKCTYRRIKIQHEINENLRKKTHLTSLHFYNYREQLFNRKIDYLRKNLEQIEPYVDDDTDGENSLIVPNGFTRIQQHFRLLKFPVEAEKRLLCQAPSYNKSSEQISTQLPMIVQKQCSSKIDQCQRRVLFYQSRLPINYSCRSTTNPHFSKISTLQQESFQSYIHQKLIDEQQQRIKNNERKSFLLKEFDELKHTIQDPHSTFSVLAALSRAILFLDSGTKQN